MKKLHLVTKGKPEMTETLSQAVRVMLLGYNTKFLLIKQQNVKISCSIKFIIFKYDNIFPNP